VYYRVRVCTEHHIETIETLAVSEGRQNISPYFFLENLCEYRHVRAREVENIVTQDKRVLLPAILGLLENNHWCISNPPSSHLQRRELILERYVWTLDFQNYSRHMTPDIPRVSIQEHNHDLAMGGSTVGLERSYALEDLFFAF
jgi:hypothetical protein